MSAVELPMGPAPAPVAAPHFPDRLHAYVWRNWQIVPTERLADVVGARSDDIVRMGTAMGLCAPPTITEDQVRRSTTTIIKHNWQLLPYEQLLALLGWTAEQMAYHLREDDFLFIKLGRLKPKCERLAYAPPDAAALEREQAIGEFMKAQFPDGVGKVDDPPLGFVARLSSVPEGPAPQAPESGFTPRFCFSYFGLTGDPFLGNSEDIYPDGLLARLAASGVDGVWLQGVLFTLAPFPWDPALSARYEERLENLRGLVARARRYGVGVYLYLNEPRAMPVAFFEGREKTGTVPSERSETGLSPFSNRQALKGVAEGPYAALCTSHPDVQQYLRDSVASICRAVPDLRGFFTITASENLTNCWSHHHGEQCPRCSQRAPAEVIAEVNTLFYKGIQDAGTATDLIVWDWGWRDEWAPDLIAGLPREAALSSVSEWSIPIERGGISGVTGEYSISTIGPGPRATKHWALARDHGMRTIAKVQVGTTWELGAVPYIPAVANVAQHLDNLRKAQLTGLMLSWTLGGYPSPALEVAAEMGRPDATPEDAMHAVAVRRFGADHAPAVIEAWRAFSEAFREFPFHGGLIYTSPVHMGAANLLWESPTGYHATMVGFPYDDLKTWRAIYPEDVFIGQFEKMADGFDAAIANLRDAVLNRDSHRLFSQINGDCPYLVVYLVQELDIMTTCAIHYRSVANQARFVVARRALAEAASPEAARDAIEDLEAVIEGDMALAKALYAIQGRDSRMGYEASNQYYYLAVDLAEKVLNGQDLLSRWLPAERAKHGLPATAQ